MGTLNITRFTDPSPEALNYFANNENIWGQPLTEENVVARRIESYEAYLEDIERSKAQYCQDVIEKKAEDIRYLEVIPKNLDTNLAGKIILYFFGGGFVQGNPETDLVITARLADTLGVSVLSPEYRLAPEHRFPAAVEDCTRFYQFVIEQYGAENIVLSGESAGGNLAMTTLIQAHTLGLPMPQALALMSPVADNTGDIMSPEFMFQDDPTLSPDRVAVIRKIYAPNTPSDDPLISPHFAEFGTWFPPILFTTGTRDCFQHQVMKTGRKMSEASIPVSIHIWEGLWHVFEFYDIPEAKASIKNMADFLRGHLTE